MSTFLNKILIGCCTILLLQSCAIGHTSHSCEGTKLIISQFVNSKKNEDWDKIEANVYKLQSCKCEKAPVFYYIYRMKTLLPNSQALQGRSPNDFIASQKLKMREQVETLKTCEVKLYLPLLNTMIKQNFDSEIVESAKELKRKLQRN